MRQIASAYFVLLLALSSLAQTRPSDIVDVKSIDPSIQVNMMYLNEYNFLGRKVVGYKANTCYVTTAAAKALKSAQARLQTYAKKSKKRYTLYMRDCYRPQKAVQDFMNWVKDEKDISTKDVFYPDLTKADLIRLGYIASVSGHSRASTFDLTIAAIDSKGDLQAIPMGTIVDFFGEKANTDHKNITPAERASRDLLLKVLSPEFKNYAKEWWHYTLINEPYPNTYFDFDVE